ncbi:MAG: DUF1295 domain-containing protein [Oscillospiraceae bacterium]|nr:DUF1295 domain-containing protein [Oscillospiraceae bacterium]
MKKQRDLAIILGIYILSFIIGYFACRNIGEVIPRYFIFDTVATVVVFIFSVIFRNSSVYDAYWSLTPMVMVACLFAENKSIGRMHMLFLAVFLVWGIRLTANWITVFSDFSYEDWRYRKYRNETPRIFWPLVNFFGIHYMPTLIVFAGMLPIFALTECSLNILVLPGILIMLLGISLEYFADRQIHEFLRSESRGEVCNIGLWKYTRHPNYLGEILFWTGVFFAMLPFAPQNIKYGIGFISVMVLFNVVSIPLMEKRQLERRPAYRQYMLETSRLLPGTKALRHKSRTA